MNKLIGLLSLKTGSAIMADLSAVVTEVSSLIRPLTLRFRLARTRVWITRRQYWPPLFVDLAAPLPLMVTYFLLKGERLQNIPIFADLGRRMGERGHVSAHR